MPHLDIAFPAFDPVIVQIGPIAIPGMALPISPASCLAGFMPNESGQTQRAIGSAAKPSTMVLIVLA